MDSRRPANNSRHRHLFVQKGPYLEGKVQPIRSHGGELFMRRRAVYAIVGETEL